MMKHLIILVFSLILSSCSVNKLNPLGWIVSEKNASSSVNEKDVPAQKEILEEDQEIAQPKITSLDQLPKKEIKHTKAVRDYCRKIDKKFLHWGWGLSRCEEYNWHHVRNSYKGDPLIWTVFGDEAAHKKDKKDMTMIMCGVHGDEITPIKFCFDVIRHLERIQAGIEPGQEELKNKLIVVAPIVSPDSFFIRRPTRTNARGVDLNRNFPTKDWNKDALRLWKHRYSKDKRRFPGKKPLSEPETLFQVNLIKRYGPNKILSVHAPLTILDYDGPEELGVKISHKATQLLLQMSREAKGYRIKNYPFFPGSLGNYAGNERSIPTYTLELPSSDNRKHKVYWKRFKKAIHYALLHDLRDEKEVNVALEKSHEEGEHTHQQAN